MKVAKTLEEMQSDCRQAIVLLELACRTFDHETLAAAAQISNLLHQLVDDRGRNKARITRLGYADALTIWRSPTILEPGEGYRNTLSGFMMGIGRDKSGAPVARGYNTPAYLEHGHKLVAARASTVSAWLDDAAIRLSTSDVLSRRQLIRYVRDQDAGAHSDAALDQLYADLRRELAFHPGSHVEIEGKKTDVASLGSGLVDHSQKMTVAARATAEKKAVGQRS